MKTAAYIQAERLCVIGIKDTPMGPIPFAANCKVEGEKDGPIDFDNVSVEVAKAFESIKPEIEKNVNRDLVKATVSDYVERARQGDQNAMSVLAMVRNAAKKGNNRAKRTMNLMVAYIKKNPVDHAPNVGFDIKRLGQSFHNAIEKANPWGWAAAVKTHMPTLAKKSMDGAIVRLANGPNLLGPTNANIKAMVTAYPNDVMRKAFSFGLTGQIAKILDACQKISPDECQAMQTGFCVGMAKRIQAIRQPKTPLSVLSPMVAWELGE